MNSKYFLSKDENYCNKIVGKEAHFLKIKAKNQMVMKQSFSSG